MLKIKSKLTLDELKYSWDEHTSPARFAGSDETMDLVYVAKRKKDKVVLVRRATHSHEPFSCVFRGRLEEDGTNSAISGRFTKSCFDYIALAVLYAILFYVRYVIISRGNSVNTINTVLAFSIVAGLLLLYNTRGTKRRYCEFLARIAETENTFYIKRNNTENE